ncbi:sulfotransferase [Cytophagaceae bacterium ABcell3]|nr:sulfotransferase [Cytophagaceae bacterium ABcell3]
MSSDINPKKYFVIAGCQRCGTTALARLLHMHPEVYMAQPLFPEPKYFLNETVSKEIYLNQYFSNAKQAIAIGEKSTSYIESSTVPKRIKAIFPEAKVIILLRDPVYRALSNYQFTKNNNLEPRTPREVFLEEKPPPAYSKSHISVSPYQYKARGEYIRYIKPWLNIFQPSNILILFYENLINNCNRSAVELGDFLGLSQPIDFSILNAPLETSIDYKENIIAKLQHHYKPYNHQLAELLNIDLKKIWKY